MNEITPRVYYMIYLALRLHNYAGDPEDQLGITLPMIAHIANLSLEDILRFTESIQEILQREGVIQRCFRSLPDRLTHDGPVRRFQDMDWIVSPMNFSIIIEGPAG